MLRLLRKSTSILILSLVLLPRIVWGGLHLETRRTHSRLSLPLPANATTEFSANNQGFTLTVKGLALIDLGLGDSARIRDERLEGVQVGETPEGVKIQGTWGYPTGVKELAKPSMEFFEYREQKPPRFMVDFWVKPGPTKTEAKKKSVLAEKIRIKEEAKKKAQEREQARAKAEDLKSKEENLSQHCKEPLTENTDIIVPFRPYHEVIKISKWFSATTPDEGFSYYEPTGKDKEAQYVRLAIKLYRQAKLGLALKTLEFFEKEFEKSQYRTEMKFLKANALIKLNLNAEADRILLTLMNEGKHTAVALHCGMFMASRLYTQKNHLSALETFMWLSRNYPEHRLNWVFHLGAGESLYALRQTERALAEYQWVVAHASEPKYKAEAALRIGDLYLDRFQYEQALAAYFESLTNFGEESKIYPAVYVNRAETLYGLQQYERAESAFKEYLAKYPGHPGAWRATFRLAEIEARKAPFKEAHAQASRRYYYETINRFPFSPGSTLARIRLAPCGDLAGFDYATADQFFNVEAPKFNSSEEVAITRYADLRAIGYTRTLVALGELDDAVDVAIEELARTRDSKTRELLGTLLSRVFRKRIQESLEAKDVYGSLKYYFSRHSEIPKEATPANPDYLLSLSRSAADLGLGDVATLLTKTYESENQRYLRRLQGREIAESKQPARVDEILKTSEASFTEAKALWIKSGLNFGGKPNEELEKNLRNLLANVGEESPHALDREVMLGLLSERLERWTEARSHSIKAEFLSKKDADPEVAYWAYQIEKKQGDKNIALNMIDALLARAPDESPKRAPAEEEKKQDQEAVKPEAVALGGAKLYGLAPLPNKDALWLEKANILDLQKKWSKAIEIYDRLVERGVGGNQARFGLARALLALGDLGRPRALKLLEELVKTGPDDFWKKLAKERLENESLRGTSSDLKT